MSLKSIHYYFKCDILKGSRYDEHHFPGTVSEEEIVRVAIMHKCKIITKNGKNGMWYLKGSDRTMDYLQQKIESNKGKSRDGVYCILLEYY